ncbi:MAG: hypothetical protein ABSC23_03835 [Bryobacteraceae bacterium]
MQKKMTAEIPAELHLRVATRAKERGVRIDAIVEEALLLYFRTPAKDIAKLSGPMAGLPSADRKRVEAYIELLKSKDPDLKLAASRRIGRLLVMARESIEIDYRRPRNSK